QMDDLTGLTVVELRTRLRERSLPTAGKKAELIKRLSVVPPTLAPVVDYEEDVSLAKEEEDEACSSKKSRKSKKKTSKKGKKSKSIDPVEELDEEVRDETSAPPTSTDEEDGLNTSNATYDVVSPNRDAATKGDEVEMNGEEEAPEGKKKDTAEDKKMAKNPTPVRRASECRRSIFNRLGLDPAKFTPSSSGGSKKRLSTTATPSSVKRSKSMVEEKEEEDTVPQPEDTVEEEMAIEEDPITEEAIAEDEEGEEVIEDEEKEEREDEKEEKKEEEAEEKESKPTGVPSEFWSDDEEETAADQSKLSEVSVAKPAAPDSPQPSTSTRRRSSAKALPQASRLPPPLPRATARGSAQRGSAGRLPPGSRFASAHARLFDGQESIGDALAKKEERKAALLKASATTQRLATPKGAAQLRQPLRVTSQQKKKEEGAAEGFKFGSTAVPKTFNFGATSVEEIQKVQKRPSAIPAPTAPIVRKKGEEKKLDAKARAKEMAKKPADKNPLLLPTIPDDSSFVDRMATPRSILNSASRTHRGAGGYTPKRGKVDTFVDTSKLSDREYQIAMEAGLLPGGSKKTSSTMKQKEQAAAEERRRHARDELLNVKRKLNMA
ncbi:hypothetical protein PMAYCL1PPCAC_13250, partial [Pristionchus mayeri]